MVGVALILACSLWVRAGDAVEAAVFYAHEWPAGASYTTTAGPVTAWTTGIAAVVAEGYPIGCQWSLNGRPVLFHDGFDSGDRNAWMLTDGFESGDAGAWSGAVGIVNVWRDEI